MKENSESKCRHLYCTKHIYSTTPDRSRFHIAQALPDLLMLLEFLVQEERGSLVKHLLVID